MSDRMLSDEILLALIKKNSGGGGGSMLDYSTTEHKTGQKWIDGKDIYEKTYILRENGVDKYTYKTGNIYDTGDRYDVAWVANMIAIRTDNETIESFNYGNTATVIFLKKTQGIFFQERGIFKTVIVTVRYTKSE